MTRTLYILWDGDSYEVEVVGMEARSIWRYRDNKNSRPEFCQYAKLDEELQHEIDNKIMKVYGEPHL